MQELRSTYKNATIIHNYSYVSGDEDAKTRKPILHDVEKSISTIIALNSDLSLGGKSELDRYLEVHEDGDTPIRVICVVGRGYWYFTDEWCFIPSDENHQETLSFIVGLFDTFLKVGLSRKRPNLVSYLLGDPPILRGSA